MSAQAGVSGTFARAVVHAGGLETAYLRAGSGEAVVVVAADLERDDVLRTVQMLSREFLVLAAVPGPSAVWAGQDPISLSRWLSGFLECLGLPAAHLFLHNSASAILTGEQLHA